MRILTQGTRPAPAVFELSCGCLSAAACGNDAAQHIEKRKGRIEWKCSLRPYAAEGFVQSSVPSSAYQHLGVLGVPYCFPFEALDLSLLGRLSTLEVSPSNNALTSSHEVARS